MKSILLLIACAVGFNSISQSVGIGIANPHSSAALDVTASDKGLLIPRLTSTQRVSIASPATGLLVYDTDATGFWYYNGSAWVSLPLALPYTSETTTSNNAFSIKNNGSGAAITGWGVSGVGLYGLSNGSSLNRVAVKAENTNPSGIGIYSYTNSNDANMVVSNPGTGDLIRGFSGPSAGALVYRVLNDGTLTTTGKIAVGSSVVPSAALEVTGSVSIADGNQANGKILTSDVNGLASWKHSSAYNTGFNVRRVGSIVPIAFNTQTVVVFDSKKFDDNNNFNTSTGVYTCPSSGVYNFNVKIQWNLTTSGYSPRLDVLLLVNNVAAEEVNEFTDYGTGASYNTAMSFSTTLKLNATDEVKVAVKQLSGGGTQYVGTTGTSFSGHRVY